VSDATTTPLFGSAVLCFGHVSHFAPQRGALPLCCLCRPSSYRNASVCLTGWSSASRSLAALRRSRCAARSLRGYDAAAARRLTERAVWRALETSVELLGRETSTATAGEGTTSASLSPAPCSAASCPTTSLIDRLPSSKKSTKIKNINQRQIELLRPGSRLTAAGDRAADPAA
jgi:hypothetical protein